MSNLPTVRPEPEPETPTSDSQKEAIAFSTGNLRRDEAVRQHIHIGGLIVFWIFVAVGVAMFVIWAWLLCAPEKWRFLNTEQRNDLQMVLLSAVGSAFFTEASKKWLSPTNKEVAQSH